MNYEDLNKILLSDEAMTQWLEIQCLKMIEKGTFKDSPACLRDWYGAYRARLRKAGDQDSFPVRPYAN